MFRLALWVAVVASCGRVGFDPIGASAEAPAGDAGACTPFDVTVPENLPVLAEGGGLAWLGDRYAALVREGSGLELYTIASDGTISSPTTFATGVMAGAYGRSTIAWNGSALAVTWIDPDLEVELFDASLTPLGGVHTLSSLETGGAQIAAAGSGFVVASAEGAAATVVEVDASGSGGLQLTSTGPAFGVTTVLATASSYVVAMPPDTLTFQRPIGGLVAQDNTLGLGSADNAIDLIGFGTGVMAGNVVAIQMLDAMGVPTSSAVPLPATGSDAFVSAALAQIGSQVRVVGYKAFGSGYDLLATDFDPSTQSFGAVTQVASYPGELLEDPTVIASPGAVLVAFPIDDVVHLVQLCP